MLKGLGSLVVRALLLCLVSTPAWAGSALYLNSQSGDGVGKGLQATYTDGNGTFAISGTAAGGVIVTFTPPSPAVSWTLEFAAPKNQSLAAGNYDHIERYPSFGPLDPGLSVNTGASFCNTEAGRFVVRDIEVDGSGNVTAFAADFEQHCNEATPALFGAIRYNSSIAYPVDAPTADAGGFQIAAQGATVTVDASLSEPGNGSVTAYAWTQLSGPAVSFANASAVSTTFTAPNVGAGGADLVLQLEVDNSLSLSSTSTVTIHVANPADPMTVLKMVSTPGDYIGQGQTININPTQALFTTQQLNAGQSVGVSVNGGIFNNWVASFVAPPGQVLQLGTYDGAGASNYEQPSDPQIGIAGDGRGCAVTGRFTVLDLQKDVNGNITSFAADFEQICNGAANSPLYGQIRFNSTVPLDAPLADAGNAQIMQQGETVTLSGSTWTIAGGDGNDITSYQWTQLSGPSVTLSDATAASPTFTAPTAPSGGEDLVFQLTVTNSLGFSSTSTVTVHVANPTADSMTLLRVEITPGGIQPGGQLIEINSSQETFVPTLSTGKMSMDIGGFGVNEWQVTLAAPTQPQQSLQVGAYNNALVQLPLNPSLLINTFFLGSGVFSCPSGAITGRFEILAIQTDGSGNLQSLAADFDEFCSGDGAAMHGMLRYNSSVALDTPEADAGGKQEAVQGTTVTLPAGSSYAGSASDSISSYQWTQLSGSAVTLSNANTASASFTAPAVNPGGADLVFQLAVTNSNGLSATDTVTVHVFNPADPRMLLHIKSDAGDPTGKGQTYDYNDLNAVFTTSFILNDFNGRRVQTTFSDFPFGPQLWSMTFTPPLNQPLQVGSYDMAENALSFGAGGIFSQPGLEVTFGQPGGPQATGRFDVLDIQTDQNGNVTSLAVDFVQTIQGASGSLHGQLRYNSAVPLNVPFADAGMSQLADPGNTITLGGGNSDAGADGATISSYQWVQVSGPSVTLTDPTGATASFTAPSVPPGGADLVFQLTVMNSNGVSSTSTITVHVGNRLDAKTRLYLASDPTDSVGQGQTRDLNLENTVFTVSMVNNNGTNNAISINANTGVENNDWTVVLAAPSGQALHAGTRYVLAQTFPFQATNAPGISVSPGFEACGDFTGLFVVRDLQFNQAGTVTSFAADFVQHCDGEPPALAGWIRYNSTVPIDTPIADPGVDQFTYSGLMPVTLDGSGSRIGLGGTLSYMWTQIVAAGDPTVGLSDPTVAKPMFLTPDVPPGGRKLVFQLTTLNGLGQTDVSTVNVTVGNENDAKSTYYYESNPGDPVGQGGNGFGASPALSVSRTFIDGFLAASFEVDGHTPPVNLGVWDLSFEKSDSEPLQTGIYRVGPGGGLALPGMLVTSENAGCTTPTGLFIVRDIGFDSQERLTSVGVDFVQHCAGATGDLRGSLRYNSTTPVLVNEPAANPGPDITVAAPGTVTLDGSDSFPGWGTITNYQWRQLHGPKVGVSNANSAQASFTLPSNMLTNGGSTFTFQLTVRSSLGLSSSAVVHVTAAYPKTNLLSLQSDAGDPVGEGATVSYAPTDAIIKTGLLGTNGVSAVLNSDGNWMLDFAAAFKQTLQVGTYSNASLYRAPSAVRTPTLFVGTKPGQCKTVTGDFTVLDVAYGIGHKISTLAVDFDQHCNGIGPALHGKLRYHSSLP